jgi:hypothetical protein
MPSMKNAAAAAALFFATGVFVWLAAAPATTPARAERPPVPSSSPTGSPRIPVPSRRVAVGAAGDIACAGEAGSGDQPDSCQFDDTAHLLAGLTGILVLGDGQYERGDYEAYRRYYGPTWGRFIRHTYPVPGNHEYGEDPGSLPNGYFRYFGPRVKGPDGLGYYSFNLPTGCIPHRGVCWHFIALSSELCFAGGGCRPATGPGEVGPGNKMYAWLRRDLRSHRDAGFPCTLAFWHHPLFSISEGSGASPATRPLWQLLYDSRADVVLNGHSHNYQRWLPQDPSGAYDPHRGIIEFVAGTGGASKYALQVGSEASNLATAQNVAFGIIRLTLSRASYNWRWVPAAGQPSGFSDTATGTRCV